MNKILPIIFLIYLPASFLGAQEITPSSSSSNFTNLVWADEFDSTGVVDNSKWFHQTKLPNGVSWYNGELQHYTNRIENSFVQDGNLHILAKRETFTDQGQTKQYTSVRLNSKFAFTYGRVEVRAKMPFGGGTWPAIWMLGKNINEPGAYWQPQFGRVSWPWCGEIDIVEHWGNNQNFVQSALHTPSSHGATINKKGFVQTTVSDSFHIYAMEWSEDKIEFSFDDSVFYTYAPSVKNSDTWPFTTDQYLLMNVAVQPPVASNFVESDMVIDYVRIFQKGAATSVEEDGHGSNWEVYPNPVRNGVHISLPNQSGEVTLKVIGARGELINSQVIEEDYHELDWSNFPSGIYTVLLQSDQNQKFFKLFKS